MKTQTFVFWMDKDESHTAFTRDKKAAMVLAQSVSDKLKGEVFCIYRESDQGENWNTKELIHYRSGLRI